MHRLLFGPAEDGRTGDSRADDSSPLDATGALVELCRRAELPLSVPEGISGLCCGTPWRSKGLTGGYRALAEGSARELFARLSVGDAVTFVRRAALPHLAVTRRLGTVALHPTCSSVHLGSDEDLRAVTEAAPTRSSFPRHGAAVGSPGTAGCSSPR